MSVFYFGLRSTPEYLESLEDVRQGGDRAAVTSVIGGFAFLHALRSGLAAATLVDVDPDAVRHWRLVSRLIDAAESLEDFLTLLSGGRAPAGPVTSGPMRFGPQQDLRRRIAGLLDLDQRALYETTYGSMSIDPSTGHGRIGPARILFSGHDLTVDHFCWHFGEGNLRDRTTFRQLQDVLRGIPITVTCGSFETIDFGEVARGEPRLVFLASNCESPLFTRRDVIFTQVARTARSPVRYISWFRDGWIDARRAALPTRSVAVASLPFHDARVMTLSEVPVTPDLARRLAGTIVYDRVDDATIQRDYGRRMLVLRGGDRAAAAKILSEVAPAFERALWIAGERRAAVFESPTDSYMQASTDIPGLEYFELNGLRPQYEPKLRCASS